MIQIQTINPSFTNAVISLKRGLRRRGGYSVPEECSRGAPHGNKVYIHADWRRRLRCIDLPLGTETGTAGALAGDADRRRIELFAPADE